MLSGGIKFLWGNYNFDHIVCEALGNSGGILCVWDANVFQKKHHIISDNFVALYGMWIPKQVKMLLISVYAPQSLTYKRMLWSYLASLISQWDGESIAMGDLNKVRSVEERWGSTFNALGANVFNDFITNSGLSEVQLEGYSFTWTHLSASKMSKLDRFLLTEGLLWSFPNILAMCLDRHLSYHRPILLREIYTDFGATPFRLYHYWFNLAGFDHLVTSTWNSTVLSDCNGMIRFKKKLQIQKKAIRLWVLEQKNNQSRCVRELKCKFSDIDKKLDQGDINGDLLLSHMAAMTVTRNQGEWVDEPSRIKDELISHLLPDFKIRAQPRDEIRNAVWNCGENKSPGPNGFTFEFFRKFWNVIGSDLCIVVEWFFNRGSFAIGCNSSFIALIPKFLDPKYVSDYRSISLIGSLYKVVTKILATRLSVVISGLISEVQTTFLPNCQILEGPFIISEILSWCKQKRQHAMIFKVDFAKAYDSIRWDYLDNVLNSFGFGSKWRSWIQGSLTSGMASILINGSPTSEFQFHCGLKPGDPLAPFLFILVMETFHLTFSLAIDAGAFNGIRIGSSLMISHIFYANDAIFIGEWSQDNRNAPQFLQWHSRQRKEDSLGKMVQDNSLWGRVISTIHGPYSQKLTASHPSLWNSIIKELQVIKLQGDSVLKDMFSRLYALENCKDCFVADKFCPLSLLLFVDLLEDRWVWDMNGDGVFRVKDVRNLLDDTLLPKDESPTRWVKCVPIKINVFAWKVFLDRLPTPLNLYRKGVVITSVECPNCGEANEDTTHIFFNCGLALDVMQLV
uniref:Putative RNA-directed DNA polymerase, eukaryota, reverse transcriptase zinc-binding domain protein n=1 Tax=Tanacetum cinerariifolium TaxID=118510 RepID=A0A6L2MRJ8_TANCI|nr:putative RNA-directed DNA polymerase, eukaryota, reverse transcriptase zinc-binding domain protein [Tanacetum cinerariifolium]